MANSCPNRAESTADEKEAGIAGTGSLQYVSRTVCSYLVSCFLISTLASTYLAGTICPASWPEYFKYRPMKDVAFEISRELRDPNGPWKVDIIVALTHCRLPNVSTLKRL